MMRFVFLNILFDHKNKKHKEDTEITISVDNLFILYVMFSQ